MKRDTRTPEQILADLRERAAALITTTEEGYPIIDTDEKREAFDAVIEQRKTIKGIAGGNRQAFFASQPFTNTAADDDFDEAAFDAAQNRMRVEFRGRMVEVEVNERTPLVDGFLTLSLDEIVADYDDGDDA